jgi:SAM-dependent methyltransferase
MSSSTACAAAADPEYAALLSQLPTVPCRDDLAHLAEKHFRHTGRAAEIGVFRGWFARHNLAVWTGKYFAVDAWQYRPGDGPDKNFADNSVNDENYRHARQALAPWAGRVTIIKNLSVAAAHGFADSSLDWVYVDALHTRHALTADLHAWWRKLRPGGLLSGDDYGDVNDTPLLPFARWNRTWRAWRRFDWEVISVMQRFSRRHCISLHVTWLHDCYRYPAWYVVKPLK